MVSLFLVALLLLAVWFIAVVAFQVTAAAIHLLLVVAVLLFAVGFLRRRFEAADHRLVEDGRSGTPSSHRPSGGGGGR